jgi:hypothetical protein
MNTSHNKSDRIIGMQDVIDRTVDAQVSRHVRRSDALNCGGVVSMPSMGRSARLLGLHAMAIGKRKEAKDGKQRHWVLTVKQKAEVYDCMGLVMFMKSSSRIGYPKRQLVMETYCKQAPA